MGARTFAFIFQQHPMYMKSCQIVRDQSLIIGFPQQASVSPFGFWKWCILPPIDYTVPNRRGNPSPRTGNKHQTTAWNNIFSNNEISGLYQTAYHYNLYKEVCLQQAYLSQFSPKKHEFCQFLKSLKGERRGRIPNVSQTKKYCRKKLCCFAKKKFK